MSTLNALVDYVKTFLASHFMYADDEWLSGCVEYLNEDADNNNSQTNIRNQAKEQWLLNDLKDICPGSLPTNLNTQTKTVLNGRYILQINAAIDIGTPSYQQYQKLQKVNTENVDATSKFEDKIPSHRMIKLYLTDGVQDISGIEYKPMRNISCDITPGCKVLIKGPVVCRKGILLLTESVVELLGGEVQEIAISNSLSSLLCSKLGIPPIQNDTQEGFQPMTPRNTNIPTPHSEVPGFDTTEQSAFSNSNLNEIPNPAEVINNEETDNLNFADEDIDFDELAAVEAEFTNESNSKRMREDSFPPNAEKKLKVDNNPNEYPDDNPFCEEDEEYLLEIESKFDSNNVNRPVYPIKVNAEPFVYIKYIKELPVNEKIGKSFKVKAQILKLLSKLSVGKDGWNLKCTIIDGTGSLDVEFTSDVLSQLVGFSPTEMNMMKKEMGSKPELKEKAVMALHKAKDSLQVLYCLIELTMFDVFKITAIHPFEEKHANLLNSRLDSSCLLK